MKKSEFLLRPEQLPEQMRKGPFAIGKTYASPLTSFLAGIVCGMLIMYALLAISNYIS